MRGRPLHECIELVDTPGGRERVVAFLRSGPYPHYEADPGREDILIRIDADGTRSRGRFVKRQFIPIEDA
ncbi:MAG TPA: hypothetical protein VHA14_00040 [Bryobacteraceae bacterium]|nr:hypothetical protein [Bryobacteraceae bacterium]